MALSGSAAMVTDSETSSTAQAIQQFLCIDVQCTKTESKTSTMTDWLIKIGSIFFSVFLLKAIMTVASYETLFDKK